MILRPAFKRIPSKTVAKKPSSTCQLIIIHDCNDYVKSELNQRHQEHKNQRQYNHVIHSLFKRRNYNSDALNR